MPARNSYIVNNFCMEHTVPDDLQCSREAIESTATIKGSCEHEGKHCRNKMERYIIIIFKLYQMHTEESIVYF